MCSVLRSEHQDSIGPIPMRAYSLPSHRMHGHAAILHEWTYESTREQLTQRARRQAGGTHAPRHATPPTPSLSVSARLVHRCARACAPEHSSPPLSYCALTRQPGGTRSTAQAPAGGSPGESPARGARVCDSPPSTWLAAAAAAAERRRPYPAQEHMRRVPPPVGRCSHARERTTRLGTASFLYYYFFYHM